MWRSTRAVKTGCSMLRKLVGCSDKKLVNQYKYTLNNVEDDLKHITDVYVHEYSDMEAVVKMREEGKWPTGTHVVYETTLLQGEELRKITDMADHVGLKMKEVTNWFEPEPEKGKWAKPGGYEAREGSYEPSDGQGSNTTN